MLAVDALHAALAAARRGPAPELDVDLRPRVRLSFDPARRSSRGGRYPAGYGVSLALAACFPRSPAECEDPHLFREYAAIARDPVIGSFTGVWRDHVRAVAAHEAAHVAQAWLRFERRDAARAWARAGRDLQKPHGIGWRSLYAAMREDFGLIKPLPRAA